jgi:6-phosphogluconolactonase
MSTICSRSVVRICLPVMMALMLAGCGGSSQNSTPPPPAAKAEFLYATGQNQILSFTVDPLTGALSAATATPGPDTQNGITATIAADPAAKFLFVYDTKGFAIDVFSINATTGVPTASGSSFSAKGLFPSGLATDSTGNYLYVAGVSAVGAFNVNRATGELTVVAGSPFSDDKGPFGVVADPSGAFIYAGNTGGIPPATISGFAIDSSSGALMPVPGSPFSTPIGFFPFSFAVHPSGKFLYADIGTGIEGWAIDSAGALATIVPGSPFGVGGTSVTIDPTGKFLYVSVPSRGGGIFGFTIDASSGTLTPMSGSPFSLPAIGRLIIDPSGQFMYSPLLTLISGINIDPSTGALTVMSGSPFPTGATLTARATLAVVKAP